MFQPPLPPEPPPPLPNGQQIPVPEAGGPMQQQPWAQQPAMPPATQQPWHHPPPQQPWGHQQLPPWGPPHPLIMMQHQHWQQQHWQHQQWHHQQLLEQQRQQWHQQQQQQQQWMQQPQQHFPGAGQMQQPALPPQPPGWPAHGQQPPAMTGPQHPQQQAPPPLSGPDASPQLPPLPPAEAAAAAGQTAALEQQPPPLPQQPPDPAPLGPPPPLDLRSLLLPPGRASRPKRLLLLLRGLPGSGKSHLARLIRQVELSQGGPAPRCHSLDDYFMVEVEQEAPADEQQQQQHPGSSLRRPGTPGAKRRLQLVQQYVHDAAMEGRYWRSLLKALGRSLGEGVHGLVLLDAPALSAEAVKEAWSAGQQAGYEVVVVAPLATDPQVCFEQNIHGRLLEEVAALAQQYEPPPATYTTATATSLLDPAAGAGAAIDDVDMAIEDLSAAPSPPAAAQPAGAAEPSPAAAAAAAAPRSRWEDDENDGGSGDAADAAADGSLRPAARPAKKARLLLQVDVSHGEADEMDAIDHQALLAGVNLELEQLDAAEEAAAAAAAGGGGRAGGLASASSMSQGGSLTSGGGSKGILKGPTTPVSAKKKVRWPDEQQPAPGVAQAQEQQPRRQAARPLAEVYWLDGLGRDGAGWRDDSPDDEAFAELSASVGAASAAAAAALSGSGSGGLARHSFAQQVQEEHRSEHNMFRTILLGPSAAPPCRPAANKPHT